ncbi:bacterial regulatory s, lacI family protein [Lactobacillus selangorensis]|uniref:Bacterial regulatory s, lacI family protein n=1 Tax=Lactobacillus selangorensis TaxID=81857 RepID=A0A0R2FK94_9LACO|nr:LacI family DNA-binding transcriptional regulator [Lactobacillus selangorensis]KRN28123.1 bacterial regulatory s, lacI family protein [Lactobacillus selangorensis]KRN31000.1 bacterial regulatory s, lacI family protein [Lactobacillus selangorensis]
MATIRDVARISGYAISTVSRVLNHKGRVAPQTRRKIEAVMDELDYVPNGVAQDLSRGATNKIGVVLPHVRHPYFAQILKGVIAAAVTTHYNVVLLPSEYDRELENHYLEQLRRKEFDGLIFTSQRISLTQLEKYTQYGTIVCCWDPGEHQINAVYSDRAPAYRSAFEWLQQHHCQQVGFLFSRNSQVSATSSSTVRTFQEVYGRLPQADQVIADVTTPEDGYRAAAKLAQLPHLDSIFTNGDDVAAAVRQYYLDHQLKVPVLIGQEHQMSGMILGIPTIDHHFDRLGRQAFQMVIAADEPVQKIKIESEFIAQNHFSARYSAR